MVGLDSEEMRTALRRVRELSEATKVACRKREVALIEHEALSDQYLRARSFLWKLLSGVDPEEEG